MNKFWKKLKGGKFLAIVIGIIAFALIAGLVGGLLARSYLLNSFYNIPFFGEIDLSQGFNNQNLIIRDAKKIVVEQNAKVTEVASSAGSSIVGVFKKQSEAKSDSATAVFDISNYYLPNQLLGQGLVVTSDGWIITNLQFEATARPADYVIITKDKNVYPLDKIIKDKLTQLNFIHALAKDLPAKKFVVKDNIKNGQLVLAINWYNDSWLSSIISQRSKDSKLVKNSDVFSGAITLASQPAEEFKGAILFDLAGDVVGLIDSQGVIKSIREFEGAVISLLKYKEIKRPSLGINYLDFSSLVDVNGPSNDSLNSGIVIYRGSDGVAVVKGSPASLAGLKEGDIITAIAGIKLDKNNSLFDLIQQHIAGEKVSIEYWRAAEKKQLEVTLGELK